MKAYIYILHFKKSDKYYVGSTRDVNRRILQHKMGHTPSTKRLGGDLMLVFSQEVENIGAARRAEIRIKSWKRRDYIERIISDGIITSLENDSPV